MKSNSKNRIYLTNDRSWAPLPLRLALGIVFFAHGSQKLFGWFGGGGIEGTGQFFADSVGLAPGTVWAVLIGLAEFCGGLLVLFGLLTRVGAGMLALVMLGAILLVHSDAFFSSNMGMEYPLTLLLVALSLLISGGGRASADAKLQSR